LDREVRRLKDQFTAKLAEIIYNGFWFSAEREFLMAAITQSQKVVNGAVRVKLYKGSCVIEGRESPNSLYDEKIASMNETDGFQPGNADGFIKIQAIRLKAYMNQKSEIAMK
jgi:argininosuccinate synthase